MNMDTNSKYKSGNGFKVPEGYFDELSTRLVNIPSAAKRESRFRFLYWSTGVAAAILIGILIAIKPFGPEEDTGSFDRQALADWVEEYDIDLYQNVSAELILDLEDEMTIANPEFEEDELIQYLYTSELSVEELLYLSKNQEL